MGRVLNNLMVTTNDILNSIADDISELNKYGIKTFPEES